jgi:DMSO reductase anchor subunit
VIANHDEVGQSDGSEFPLKAFTVMAPAAVGLFIFLGIPSRGGRLDQAASALPLALLTLAMIGSLGHLGRPLSAWLALRRPRTSWLSREIWLAGLSAVGMLLSALLTGGVGLAASMAVRSTVFWATALLGLGLLVALGHVYRLRTVPQWDTRWTQAGFFFTAAAVGGFVMALLDALGWVTRGRLELTWIALPATAALLAGGYVSRRVQTRLPGAGPGLKRPPRRISERWGWALRLAASVAGTIGAVGAGVPALFAAVLLALAAEWHGRTQFYLARPK